MKQMAPIIIGYQSPCKYGSATATAWPASAAASFALVAAATNEVATAGSNPPKIPLPMWYGKDIEV